MKRRHFAALLLAPFIPLSPETALAQQNRRFSAACAKEGIAVRPGDKVRINSFHQSKLHHIEVTGPSGGCGRPLSHEAYSRLHRAIDPDWDGQRSMCFRGFITA